MAKSERPFTSKDTNSIFDELRFAGDRDEIIKNVALIEQTLDQLAEQIA